MAIIREFHKSENTINYLGSLAFLCAISCTIIMLRFRGFKATFNISSYKQRNFDDSPGVSLIGAYRINKDELFGTVNYPDPPKKITPSMVTLPAAQLGNRKDISKSTSNLVQPVNNEVNTRQSTPNIPQVVPEPLTRDQIKEQKKLEKQRLDEQKKQAKLAAKEQERAEKLRKEREKQTQETKAKEMKKSKRKAPQPRQQTDNVQAAPEITRSDRPETANSLESSISRSSGPPPYTPQGDIINNTNDISGNTSFAVDDSTSWEMISQHRQQINRPLVVKSLPKQTHLDLNYSVGPTTVTANSDA